LLVARDRLGTVSWFNLDSGVGCIRLAMYLLVTLPASSSPYLGALAVPQWRVPEQPVGFAGRARVLVDDGERLGGLAGNVPGMLGGVTDRRRTADELWSGVVTLTDSV
jgi:hypothetical protein